LITLLVSLCLRGVKIRANAYENAGIGRKRVLSSLSNSAGEEDFLKKDVNQLAKHIADVVTCYAIALGFVYYNFVRHARP
jgi:hypothetical protein